MEWSVLATFAGVLVAAFGAAWAIVREQSPMRQLERVSAVLKDMPEGDSACESLEVVRRDLAKRINSAYRAPREWFFGIAAWAFRIGGWLVFVVAYGYAFLGLEALLPPTRDPRDYGAADWLELAAFFGIFAAVAGLLATQLFHIRNRNRRKWLDEHHANATHRTSV
ncbi:MULTISPECIES: hypothetical protein [unclassified Curtobacterium]|uniref:hypothetical protein n=1 Tax=unclassified Curtobacterium TaxID=257496 RepID=UPI0037F44B32